jgi:hypothetical protein
VVKYARGHARFSLSEVPETLQNGLACPLFSSPSSAHKSTLFPDEPVFGGLETGFGRDLAGFGMTSAAFKVHLRGI